MTAPSARAAVPTPLDTRRARAQHIVVLLLSAVLVVAPADAQAPTAAPSVVPGPAAPGTATRLDAVDHAARLARIALTGDLGLPPLPPVSADSPAHDLLHADRFPWRADHGAYAGVPAPELQDGLIPKGPDGTGTDKNEVFQYMLPWDYDPDGEPIPLVVGYHGFGASAASVASLSTLDDEANLRGWAYLAPTGIDDQLFGSPVSQQNTEAAIRWMLEQFAIDRDRIHMVGFSMGGGICANFAARRRDPQGLMIAGLGLVSATSDWTMAFFEGNAAIKDLLKNPYNFGAHPNQAGWLYQQASGMHFDPDSYPALPGDLLPGLSMATNLGSTPVWLTWDSDDPVAQAAAQNPVRAELLTALGGRVEVHEVTGTLAGQPAQPAPHSWAVVDVPALFDFLEPLRVERRPARLEALVDRDARVGHLTVTQAAAGAFSRLTTRLAAGLDVTGLENVAALGLDGRRVPALPAPLVLRRLDDEPLAVTLGGLDPAPTHLLDPGGRLVHDVRADPLSQTLALTLDEDTPALSASMERAAGWSAALVTEPNPVPVGQAVQLRAATAPGSPLALLIAGPTDGLVPLAGGLLSVVPVLPAGLAQLLPLAPDGLLEVGFSVPGNPGLKGTHAHLQLIVLDGQGQAVALSNHWMADFL